jgi:hypothetical protein
VIVKVLPRKGGSTRASARKLMAYLLGPGDLPDSGRLEPRSLGNRHTQPTVVASWDPTRTTVWAQQCAAVDWSDPDAAWRALHTLAQGVGDEAAAGVRLEDAGQARNAVWHTIMAAHPDDGQLTDDQWQAIGVRLMHQTGLHPEGSDNPVRWVAVRHGANAAGADHIHVMAVLVRLDGTRASIHNDVFAAQAAARWAEQHYQLTPGRGRTSPADPGQGVRADRPSSRSDMAAATKAGPPYRKPSAMSRPTWERVQQEGRDRTWTRQGRARAAVLSAAARAISGEHLIALVEEQCYQVRLRYSHTNPGQVTGWSVVAPPDKRARSPKAFAGRQLGPDCTWPALIAHINARGLSDGLGIISTEEGQAMIDRARMAAAGWGGELIDRVIATDQALIASGPHADPALAYWMRDVFWQVAWALEQSRGQHGVWTDAAYLYSAIATGGPPAPPIQVQAALAHLLTQYDLARSYLDQVEATATRRAQQSTTVTRRSAAVDRWADSLDARPHIPKYLSSPGGAQYAGTAAVAIALTTADIRTHTVALQQAAEAHRAQAHHLRALAAEDAQARAYIDEQLRPWIRAAKQEETQLRAALDAHAAANAAWREASGRLLAEARAAGDHNAALRVSGLDAAYGRGAALPIAP